MATLGDILKRTQPNFQTLTGKDVSIAPPDPTAIAAALKPKPAPVTYAEKVAANPKVASPIRAALGGLQKVSNFLFPKPTSPEDAKQRGLITLKGPFSGKEMYLDPGGAVASMRNVSQEAIKQIAKSKVAKEIVGKVKTILPGIADDVAAKAGNDLVNVKTSKGVQAYIAALKQDVTSRNKPHLEGIASDGLPLRQQGGVPSPTTASKPSAAAGISTGSGRTGKEGVSAQRADTSGPFDGTIAYHGTHANVVGDLKASVDGAGGPGLYVADTEGLAREFGDNVLKLDVSKLRIKDLTFDEWLELTGNSSSLKAKIAAQSNLAAQGFDGLRINGRILVFPQSVSKVKSSPSIPKELEPLAVYDDLGFPRGVHKDLVPIKLNGKTVGGISTTKKPDYQRLEIHHIRITPEAQGKGLGTKAVTQLFEDNPDVNELVGHATRESKPFWQKLATRFTGSEGNIFIIERTDFFNKVKGGTPTGDRPFRAAAERRQTHLNLDRLKVGDEATGKLVQAIEDIRPELEKVKGKPLQHAEVLKAAQESAILSKATSREATLKSEAALLATRQNLAAMAEGKGVSADFIDQLRIVSAEATRRGRELNALGIGADPIAKTTKGELVKKLLDAGIEADELIKAAEGVDFTNQKQVTEFYRRFIKPTKTEWIDEYRYINLLSSPRTHIVNAFSNLIQGTVLNPATRLATGAIDAVMAGLTGRERAIYAKEVAPYYRGFFSAVPQASSQFLEAMRGNIIIERPDLARIPTNSKFLRPFQAIPRVLEAGDVFFRTLVTEGEKQAIAARLTKQGKALTDKVLTEIEAEAREKAEYYVFRKALDPSNEKGQGVVLSAIDKATSAVYNFRKVPGVKWFIPFVQTPMNILKQGLEYSPLGVATLPGATNKAEQLGKTMIGSVVFLGAASLAMNGRVTWAAPTGKAEKDAFYNSGRQPYSIKIGDSWVSFSKLGPVAYPVAMAAAMQWYTQENPKAIAESSAERVANVLQGIAQFFSDQSYMQGLKSIIDVSTGETRLTGVQSAVSSSLGQLIPLASLQRWVSRIIDPVYRQPESEFNLQNLIQSIQKDLPIVSQSVPEIEGSLGRPNPILNSFSPVQVTPIKKRYESNLQQIRRRQRAEARREARRER